MFDVFEGIYFSLGSEGGVPSAILYINGQAIQFFAWMNDPDILSLLHWSRDMLGAIAVAATAFTAFMDVQKIINGKWEWKQNDIFKPREEW